MTATQPQAPIIPDFLPPPARATDARGAAALAVRARIVAALVEGEADLRPLVQLARTLGAAGAGNLLVPHVVLPALLLAGADVDGGTTTALGEGDEDLDTASAQCSLRRVGDGYRLDGVKPLVSGAIDADRAVLAARLDNGVALALVDLRAEGVARRRVATIGRGPDGDVSFEDVRVPTGDVIAPTIAASRLPRAVTVATVTQAAEGAGMLDRLLELSVRQGHERHAFGRPVGSFQSFQQACAEMAMERELADTLVARAAATSDVLDAARARAFVAAAAVRGSRAAVHLQGGKGFLDDHEVARLYRLAKESQLRWGSEHWHLRRVAHHLATS